MGWAVKKVEELGVEMWLDASIYGISLCKECAISSKQENILFSLPKVPIGALLKYELHV
jgi:hypothetical protein